MSYVPFIDITGTHAHLAPLVKGGIRAYYATGSQGIEETAAQIAAAKAAGMGIILIDQTPSLSLFAAGLADVADVEAGAGYPASAAAAVAHRQAHTWQSTLYVSYSALPDLRSHIKNPAGVMYGVADYSWSLDGAEALLAQHADWAYCQYGDNITNANTLVPGTNVTCGHAMCDIDVAKSSWAAQFLPPAPKPPDPGPYLNHVLPGQTVTGFAVARGADPLTLLERSVAHWTAADKARILGLPLGGFPVYTANP